MTHEELKRLEETKSRNFNRKFGKRYGVKLLGLQGHCNPQKQCFFDIDFLFGSRMTAEAIGYMCENIAAWMGGELRGTVNIDFAGRPSLCIVVEMPCECFPTPGPARDRMRFSSCLGSSGRRTGGRDRRLCAPDEAFRNAGHG